MKKYVKLSIISVLFFSAVQISADEHIKSDIIIESIDAQQTIKFENVVIDGDLRFIDVRNKELITDNSSVQKQYHCYIDVPIEFINCTFTGSIIGYLNRKQTDEMYSGIFRKRVVFTGCRFEKDVLFKYSKFNDISEFRSSQFSGFALFKYAEFDFVGDFENSMFYEEANFKYTKFRDKASFKKCIFNDIANFKYTDPGSFIDFSKAEFNEEANFKYMSFSAGVSFANSVFYDEANFKYSHFFQPFETMGVKFLGSTNFKYTTLENREFRGFENQESKAY